MGKVIFLANRLPFELEKTEEGWQSKDVVSGLVTGVLSVLRSSNGVWCGWSGQNKEISDLNRDIIKGWEKENCFAVDVPTDLLVEAHEQFNNKSLWALFHSFVNYVDFNRKEWEAYKEYNELFSNCVLEHYEEGDTIAIQDFQLMLVPSLLREKLPNAKISFFLHIPFPTSDIFEKLPIARELIAGVLGADYIGFHTRWHVKAFTRAARRVNLEIPERCRIEANPVGVDVSFWENTLQKPEIQAKARWMKACFQNKGIILATERLDFTKGIKERLKAYEYLLTNYPELHEKVVLVQVAVLSRQATELYRKLGEEVHKEVGRINGKFGKMNWTPIYYTNIGYSQEDLCALYSISKVACVTPLVDGLNLVSKEYVISGSDRRALILSKFAGASEELKDAYIVNPYDTEMVGELMYKSLHHFNTGKLKKAVKNNNISDWANKIINI